MKAAVKEPSSHTSTQLLSGMVLQLLQKQPFIVWGASLVLVLLTGSIALKGLMSPGPEPDSPPTPIAQAQKLEDAKQPQKSEDAEVEQPSNLWLFGAIGLGCAAGSFLIAKRLEQTDSPQPIRQKPQVKAAQAPTAMTRRVQHSQVPSRSVRRRKPVHRHVSTRRVAVPAVAVAATPAPVSAYSTTTVMTEPVVTVVPDHETHPLDWGDASLADMMDLRKQRPLSHWL